jgi:two-component system, response regulator YesN
MKRILIVEDEKPLREAFAFLLTQEGYEIGLAENGQIALKKLPEFRPDLILLDMLMPVMNGLEFLRLARLPVTFPATKTLLLSNLSDPITLDDAHLYGVTQSVLKADLSPLELASVVKKMVTSEHRE